MRWISKRENKKKYFVINISNHHKQDILAIQKYVR